MITGKKIFYTLTLCCLFCTQTSKAQVTKEWEQIVNRSDYITEPYGLEVDSLGNSWILTRNDLALDVYHYDPNGNMLWVSGPAIPLSGANAPSMKLDHSKNCIISADILDSITSYINVIKYSTGGNQLWRYIFSDPGYAGTMAIDHDDNICVAATYLDSTTNRLLLAKIDENGSLLWQQNYSIPTPDFLYPSGVKILNDPDNNLFVCSVFLDFSDSSKLSLLKITPSGTIVWDKVFSFIPNYTDGSHIDLSEAFPSLLLLSFVSYDQPTISSFNTVFRLDTAGNLLHSDSFPLEAQSIHEFQNGGYLLSGSRLQFVDSSDNIQWTDSYGHGNDLLVDNAENIYMAGSDSGKYVLLKYSSNGNLAWAEHYDDNGLAIFGSYAKYVRKDGLGNIFITGQVDNDHLHFGGHTATLKYREQPISVQDLSSPNFEPVAFPNPTNNKINLLFNSTSIIDVEIILVDFTGRTLLSKKMKTHTGTNDVELELENFSKGIYSIHLKTAGTSAVTKVVLQ